MVGIYAIQNNVNGKIYVGQSVDIERRWAQEKQMKRLNVHLLRAMKKYTVKKFSFYILEECSKEALNEREAFYIKLYHSLDPKFGYNKTSGGDSSFIRAHQKLSEEHKRKISEANKNYHPSKETLNKIKAAREKTILEQHKIDIWCLETNKIYHSIEEVIEKLGIKKGQVFKCLRKTIEKSNGYHICYANEKDTRVFNLHPYVNNGGTKNWKSDTRKKISEKAKVRWDNMANEQKQALSEKLRKANLGKALSEEHKRKISESQKGIKRKPSTGKAISEGRRKNLIKKAIYKIRCIETGDEEYSSQAMEDLMRNKYNCKVNKKGILNSLKNKDSTSDGFHFEKIQIKS